MQGSGAHSIEVRIQNNLKAVSKTEICVFKYMYQF